MKLLVYAPTFVSGYIIGEIAKAHGMHASIMAASAVALVFLSWLADKLIDYKKTL